MLQIVIKNLSNLRTNDVASDLVKTFEGKRPTYSDYDKTPYRSFRNYQKKMALFNGWLKGKFQKDLVDTNLIFTRTNLPVNFASKEDQGVGFGWTLIDYITKRPIIIDYTDFVNDQNVFKSSKLNLQTGLYDDSSMVLSSNDPLVFGNEIMQVVKSQIDSYKINNNS